MRQKISGSVIQREGSKYWSLVLHYYDTEGKRKQKWETTRIPAPGNKREANAKLKERITELEMVMGDRADPRMDINALIDVWLQAVRSTVRNNTYERYSLNAEKIKLYYCKNPIKVVDYTRADARKILSYMYEKGKVNRNTGKREPMALNSVRDIRSTLQMAFDFAIEEGIIVNNPVRNVKVKNREPTETTNKYLTREEAKEFIEFCYDIGDELADVITAAINYGLRRSEILGLRECDLDCEKQALHIVNTVTATKTVHVEEKTKNASSTRVLPIASEELLFWARVLAKKRLNEAELGEDYKKNDFLFCWSDGTPYRTDYLTSHTKLLFKRFGRPELHFHSFRHTYASLLYAQGVDLLTAQRLLGHAEGSATTMQIYTHISREKLAARPVGLMPEKQRRENDNGEL